MKMEAELLGFPAPVRAFVNCYAFHVDQPPIEREDELLLPDERCMVFCFATLSPKPPRVVVVVVAGFGAMAVFGTVMLRPPVAEP